LKHTYPWEQGAKKPASESGQKKTFGRVAHGAKSTKKSERIVQLVSLAYGLNVCRSDVDTVQKSSKIPWDISSSSQGLLDGRRGGKPLDSSGRSDG
jgi:hypothetical protein